MNHQGREDTGPHLPGPRPFLKWAGGKGKLVPAILARAPAPFGAYHEPFLGGGAVFFAVRGRFPDRPARLNDANAELTACYRVVRDRVDDLVEVLSALAGAYGGLDPAARAQFYYARREEVPDGDVGRAARTIFLNRTCYNGLYRVNAAGRFNVPHGRYRNPRILDAAGLRAASRALAGVELAGDDFGAACAQAAPGDFVYLDPPYQPLSETANFTAYTAADFGPGDQERLAETFERLSRRGVAAILSNSDHPWLRGLYEGRGYGCELVPMSRAINSRGDRRAPVGELLIDNLQRPEVLAALAGLRPRAGEISPRP